MELRECPFCGGEASFDHDDNGWNWVVCEKCGVSTDCRTHTMEDCHPLLAEQWNRRASPASAPAGWKLVPVEPTEEMVNAFKSADLTELRRYGVTISRLLVRFTQNYRAMLAAAPTQPASEDRKDATLKFAVREVLKWVQGDFPTEGYLRDNDESRKAIAKLKQAMQEGKP